jgi:PhnB protein
MSAVLNPYLNFRGNARQAMEFYASIFGGELNVSTFADYQMAEDPLENDQVMHSQLETDAGFTLMGADVPARQDINPNGSISLSGDDEPLLRGYWDKLAEGANIVEPLEKAPWGDSFGMLVDKYGVFWLVNITGADAPA